MRYFAATIAIDAPPSRVWQVIRDVEHWHEWTRSVSSITLRDQGPLAVGSRALVRQPKLPPALWTVSTLEPDRGFTWISTAPGVRSVARHDVEPEGTGSRATLSVELQGLLGGLLGRMIRGITERYLAMEAAGLKARSEER